MAVHKSQGLTLGKVRLGLDSRTFATGLTFVVLSRVKQLDDILLMDNVDYIDIWVRKFSDNTFGTDSRIMHVDTMIMNRRRVRSHCCVKHSDSKLRRRTRIEARKAS